MTSTTPRTSWRRSCRLLAALAVLTLATSGAVLADPAPTPVGAQVPPVAGASCAAGQGVTVVVDFNGLPGGIRVGCAPGAQASGLSALAAAGFAVGMGDVPGVVCTIDGAPVEGYPFCWSTGGYWSYWRAPRGGSWAFSPVGAGGGPLPVDSVEGWSWAPGFASSAPRANEASAPPPTTTTTSTSTTSTPTTSTSTTAPTSTSTSAPQGATSTSAPVDTSAPASTAAVPPSSPSTAPGAVAGSGEVAPSGAAPGRTLARTGSDARGPLTAAVVLLLAGAVLVATSRRLAPPHR